MTFDDFLIWPEHGFLSLLVLFLLALPFLWAARDAMHDEAMAEYKKAQGKRHKALAEAAPLWRKVEKALRRVSERTRSLQQKAASIDAQMERYERLREGDASVERALSASGSAPPARTSPGWLRLPAPRGRPELPFRRPNQVRGR